MENINTTNYVTVFGEYLKNTNEETKRIWDKALISNFDEIVKVREGNDEKESKYLVDTNVYFSLINAARLTKDGIDPYGIPNVNFTLIDETDDRWTTYQKQRLERGFDNSETWSLDSTISQFIEPRLKVFKELKYGHPSDLTIDKWDKILDKMIQSFELINNDELKKDLKNREDIIDEGLDLFREYFFHLWW